MACNYMILPVRKSILRLYVLSMPYFNTNFRRQSLERQKMEIINIKDECIKLGQALKLSGLAGSGVDAKVIISGGDVKVNGEKEFQRGKKLYHGDVVEYNGSKFRINAAGRV